MIIDLHVHLCKEKDYLIDPHEIIARAKNTILDGIVFIVNEINEDMIKLKDYGNELGLVILFGTEVHTDKGHMLVYLPDIEILKGFFKFEGKVEDLINKVNASNGVVVAAHPYAKNIDRPLGDGLFNIQGLTAIETESGYSDKTANMLAYDAAARLGISMIGGSATKEDLEKLGSIATLFAGKIKDERELVDKLKNSRYYPVAVK